MEKYKGKYRISSHRHPQYDYTNDGSYFITINTKFHLSYFGSIRNSKMILNRQGFLLQSLINEIPHRFKFITLDTYVIMPNHIHLLLCIHQSKLELKLDNTIDKRKFMDKESIPKVIRWLKARFSYDVKRYTPYFSWQRNYHDHIIRNKVSYERIKNYIDNNPEVWEEDKFYKKHQW